MPATEIAPLSVGALRLLAGLRRAVVIGLVLLGAVLLAAAVVLVRDDDDASPPATSSLPAVSAPASYDVDRDGRPDFVQISGEVLAVPPDGDGDGSLGVWLPVAGTVVAAFIAGGAALAVAMVNREGGRKLAELAERHEALVVRLNAIDGDEAF